MKKKSISKSISNISPNLNPIHKDLWQNIKIQIKNPHSNSKTKISTWGNPRRVLNIWLFLILMAKYVICQRFIICSMNGSGRTNS
jgi:hypothetical protein